MSGAKRRSVILGTGSELPGKVITNHDLEKTVETSGAAILIDPAAQQWAAAAAQVDSSRILE